MNIYAAEWELPWKDKNDLRVQAMIYSAYTQVTERCLLADGLIAKGGKMSIIKRLLETKEAKAERLFHEAIARGDRSEVEKILKERPAAAKSSVDKEGVTALHIAAAHDQVEIAEIILRHHADINAIGGSLRRTPLDVAAFYGSLAMTEWLLDHGAQVNRETNLYSTIHYLIPGGRGAYPSRRDDLVATWKAAKWGAAAPKILLLLIRHGADVNKRIVIGGTPLEFAKNQNQPGLAEILRSHGARE